MALAAPLEDESVTVGSQVTLRYANGEEDSFRIVRSEDSDPFVGRVSVDSPVARALLGRRMGETISFRAPGGVQQVVILAIE